MSTAAKCYIVGCEEGQPCYKHSAPHSRDCSEPTSPAHYKTGDVECIDAIRSALGPTGFRDYCRGNVIKYLWRAEHKGKPEEDYGKAMTYLGWITNAEVPALCHSRSGDREREDSDPV